MHPYCETDSPWLMYRIVGLVVKASDWRVEDLGSIPVGLCPGRVIPVASKLILQWLPCQAPGAYRVWDGLVQCQ